MFALSFLFLYHSLSQIYNIIQAMSDGAVKMGLSRDTATRFAAQTVLVCKLFCRSRFAEKESEALIKKLFLNCLLTVIRALERWF